MNAPSSDQMEQGAAQPSGSPDPGLVKLVEALARAHARRDNRADLAARQQPKDRTDDASDVTANTGHPPDPDLVQLAHNLLIGDARLDHLRATGQRDRVGVDQANQSRRKGKAGKVRG